MARCNLRLIRTFPVLQRAGLSEESLQLLQLLPHLQLRPRGGRLLGRHHRSRSCTQISVSQFFYLSNSFTAANKNLSPVF